MVTPAVPPTSPGSTPPADLLLVDGSADATRLATILRGSYRVSTTASADVARQFLQRHPPALVVTELELDGFDGVEICREAKELVTPLPVLVTTSNAERVPYALVAGCDAVLLKPFAPNLLFARIGRLLRERSDDWTAGTNRVWPNTFCPYCNHPGVTSFEFCSHRRAWYACLQCKKAWIAKRQE